MMHEQLHPASLLQELHVVVFQSDCVYVPPSPVALEPSILSQLNAPPCSLRSRRSVRPLVLQDLAGSAAVCAPASSLIKAHMLPLPRAGCCVTTVQQIQVLSGSLRPFIPPPPSPSSPPFFCRSVTLKAVWLQELQKQQESLRSCQMMLE